MLRGGRSLRLAQSTFRHRGPRRSMCEDASNNESGPQVLFARKLPLTSRRERLDLEDLMRKVEVVEEAQLLNHNRSPSGSAIWFFNSARSADRALKTIQRLRSSGQVSIDVRPGALNVKAYEAAFSRPTGTRDLTQDAAGWSSNAIPRSALKRGLAPQMFLFEQRLSHDLEENVNEEIDTAPMWEGSWSIESLFFGPDAVRNEFGGRTLHDPYFNLPEPGRKTTKEVPLSEDESLLLPDSTFYVGKKPEQKHLQEKYLRHMRIRSEEEQLHQLNNEVVAEKLNTAVAAMGLKGRVEEEQDF